MKKIFALTMLLLSLLSLSSCQVNWFGATYDVPWYTVVIPVLLLFAVCYAYIITRNYLCPKCKTVFKPRWYHVSVGFHFGKKRLLRCPVCHRRGFCKRAKKERK